MTKYKIESEDGEGSPWCVNGFSEELEDESTLYTWYISGPIIHVGQYTDFLTCLRQANEGDIIDVNLKSDGGSLAVSEIVSREIRETRAHVNVIITSECSSAATAWVVLADSSDIDDNSSWLIHEPSYGAAPETKSNVELYVAHSKIVTERWLHRYYDEILTQGEIARLLTGYQMWLTGDEMSARLRARDELRQIAREQEYEAEREAEIERQMAHLDDEGLKKVIRSAKAEQSRRKK
jgi:ATP-dependent protease ClpP protease subunit